MSLEPKRILQLRSTELMGGAETVLLELSRELASLGYHSIVGVLNNTRKPNAELVNLAAQYALPSQVFDCAGKVDPRTIVRLRQFIEKERVQIIHAHGYKARFYALLCHNGAKAVPVTTCHLWDKYSRLQNFYVGLDKFWLNRFSRVAAVSEAIKEEVLESGVADRKVRIIENGIDVRRFNGNGNRNRHLTRRALGLRENSVLVGAVGRLVEQKGFDLLLQAARTAVEQMPNLIFLIVGDGPARAHLEALRSQLGLERHLRLLGERNDIPDLLAAFDVFVMSSRDEGLPMVLLEAMAAEKPVIATRVGAIPRVVVHGESGLLVRPDARELRHALLELLRDRDRARELGRAAGDRVRARFSSRAMAEKYVQLYSEAFVERN